MSNLQNINTPKQGASFSVKKAFSKTSTPNLELFKSYKNGF